MSRQTSCYYNKYEIVFNIYLLFFFSLGRTNYTVLWLEKLCCNNYWDTLKSPCMCEFVRVAACCSLLARMRRLVSYRDIKHPMLRSLSSIQVSVQSRVILCDVSPAESSSAMFVYVWKNESECRKLLLFGDIHIRAWHEVSCFTSR